MRILPISILRDDCAVHKKQNLGFSARMVLPVESLNKVISIGMNPNDIKIRAIYDKLRTQLPEVNANTIKRIMSHFKEYSDEEILTTMYRLTKYSTMASFIQLRDSFQKNKISEFITFENDYKSELQNPLSKNSNHSEFVIKNPLNINMLFDYFFKTYKGKAPLLSSEYKSIVVDKNVLNLLKEKDLNSPFFSKVKFVYIKDFEGTYNVFEQNQDFEELVRKNLEKLNDLKNIYPDMSLDELLDLILNPTLKQIKLLDIEPLIIDSKSTPEISVEIISKNLSPIFPNYDKFHGVLHECMKTINSNEQYMDKFLDLIYKKIYAYSPKTFLKKIENLKQLVEDNVKGKGKDIDKIFYCIPNLDKSYSMFSYLYQQVNKIDKSKFIYADLGALSYAKIYKALNEFLPKDSTIVILDDASISGSSFVESIHYVPGRNKRRFDMMFATVYSSDIAQNRFDDVKGNSNDDLISVDYQELICEDFKKYDTIDLYFQSILMLPHTAPDNNPYWLAPLSRLFYPAPNFVQESWDCFYL